MNERVKVMFEGRLISRGGSSEAWTCAEKDYRSDRNNQILKALHQTPTPRCSGSQGFEIHPCGLNWSLSSPYSPTHDDREPENFHQVCEFFAPVIASALNFFGANEKRLQLESLDLISSAKGEVRESLW